MADFVRCGQTGRAGPAGAKSGGRAVFLLTTGGFSGTLDISHGAFQQSAMQIFLLTTRERVKAMRTAGSTAGRRARPAILLIELKAQFYKLVTL